MTSLFKTKQDTPHKPTT